MDGAQSMWERAAPARHSPWRFYPLGLAGAMLLVFAVNGAMVWTALATFPGAASANGFDESNVYNAVIAEAARQKALGWQVEAGMRDGRTAIRLRDRAGRALAGATVAAEARRPLGPSNTTPLSFAPAGDGVYLADAALPLAGQWDLALRIVQGTGTMRLTRRVLVP